MTKPRKPSRRTSGQASIGYCGAVRAALTKFLQHACLALQICRERQQLKVLSTEQLQDIGISREDALKESARAISDLPRVRSEPQLNQPQKRNTDTSYFCKEEKSLG